MNVTSHHLKFQDSFMVIENSDVMVEVISLKGRKICLQSLVSKSKRKVYMKQSKNCCLDRLLEEFTKLIKNSLNF